MFVTRVLDPIEYETKLANTELDPCYKTLPLGTQIIVVEDENVVIGTWALIPYYHVHGFWISDSHRRKAGVARKLISYMFEIVRSLGYKTVLTASLTSEVESYFLRLNAVQLPGKHFALPVGKES